LRRGGLSPAPSLLSEMLKTAPHQFIHELRFDSLPAGIVAQAKRCVLDLIGVAASGARTDLSRIVRHFAVGQMGASNAGARLIFDGRRASPTGAAYAGASTIDAFDAHDGHRLTKGHAGVALLPALLAVADQAKALDGRELITSLAMGYEIATRAGIALHATVSDYHTSGAWNALGCAAIGARYLRLNELATRHALGIAEYHGPRSQMMRCIDHPTMVKDGSGWGALAGVSAAYLAADGFTGAPALLIEGEAEAHVWDDLGIVWEIARQYFKPDPVCRWSQPAMEATTALIAQHQPARKDIAAIEIRTFAQAVRLGVRPPRTTEEAQYAIGFPVAAILARGRLGPAELSDEGLIDVEICAMLERIRIVEEKKFSDLFPQERWAIVEMTMRNGEKLSSPPMLARGDPENPLSDGDISLKFHSLAGDLSSDRRTVIEQSIAALDSDKRALPALMAAILAPVDSSLI
jgi:2-methylcitrate dehydratase PrpD